MIFRQQSEGSAPTPPPDTSDTIEWPSPEEIVAEQGSGKEGLSAAEGAAPTELQGQEGTAPPSAEPTVTLQTPKGPREVPLSQVEEWEKGYLRQQDYSRKTETLARLRDQMEPLRQWQDVLARDPQLVRHIQQYFQGNGAPPQEAMEPEQFVQQWQGRLNNLENVVRNLQGFVSNQEQHEVENQISGELEYVKNKYRGQFPGLPDKEFERLVMVELPGYCAANGIPNPELGFQSMTYGRAIQAARAQTQDTMNEVQKKRQAVTGIRGAGGEIPNPAKKIDFEKANWSDLFEMALQDDTFSQ